MLIAGIKNIMSNSNSMGANTIKTLVTNMFIMILSLGTGLIIARLLGSEGRGEHAAMILWPQFLSSFVTLGIPSALIFHLKKNPEKSDSLIAASMVFAVISGVIITIIGIIIMPILLNKYSSEVINFGRVLMLTAPIGIIGYINVVVFQVRDEYKVFNRIRYIPPIATLLILVMLIFFDRLTPYSSGLAYLIPSIPLTVWGQTLVFKYYKIVFGNFKLLWESLKELLDYGIRSYGIDVMKTLNSRIDQILVVGLLSPVAMGLYVVSLSLSRNFDFIVKSIVTVLFPKTSGLPKEQVMNLTGRSIRISLILTVIPVVIMMFISPYIITILYGAEYLPGNTVLRILLIEVVFTSLVELLAQPFMALGRPGIVTLLQMSGVILNIPLLLILIPIFGLEGVAISLLIATSLRLLFIIICYPLILKVYPPNIIFSKEDLVFIKKKIIFK